MKSLAESVVDWQRVHGRHELPWQQSREPYPVWVSEIMLQQTQVATAVPYFSRFIERFPTVGVLAEASEDEVLGAWSGLGYYGRARNLHRTARIVAERGWPDTVDSLETLPGIGRSTAAAIASFSFGRREAILDGNVRRVFARVFGNPAAGTVDIKRLWIDASREIDDESLALTDVPTYIQGLMDLGATLCTRNGPSCARCPLSTRCVAFAQQAFDRYPAPRKARVLPVREVRLLLIRAGDAFLLERRPARGLWGGLWSLPELAMITGTPAAASPRKRGTTIDAPIARFEHVFTHFRMRAEVWALDLESGAIEQADAFKACESALAFDGTELVRLDPNDSQGFANAPLPGPIRTLLAQLARPDLSIQTILRSDRTPRTR